MGGGDLFALRAYSLQSDARIAVGKEEISDKSAYGSMGCGEKYGERKRDGRCTEMM